MMTMMTIGLMVGLTRECKAAVALPSPSTVMMIGLIVGLSKVHARANCLDLKKRKIVESLSQNLLIIVAVRKG